MSHDWATTKHRWLQLGNTELGTYNLWDSYNTARLPTPLLRELASNRQSEYFEQITVPLSYAVLRMQQRGLQVDPQALKTLRADTLSELHELDRGLHKALGPVNLGSDQQVSRRLYDGLGLKPPKVTAKGHRSVDQEALTRCLRDLRKKDEPHRSVLYDLLHRSRLDTVRSRYLSFELGPDSRVRPTVKIGSTKTTRFAYEDPPLQQYPPECRYMFVAKPGHVLLSADYSQLEARILFHLAQDKRAIEQLQEPGGDIHAANARDLFQLTESQWLSLSPAERKARRNYAKSFLYRKLYGGTAASGDKKLVCPCPRCAHKNPDLVKLTTRDAVAAEQRWDARHPEIARYYTRLFSFVREHRYFEPLLGSRRYLFAPMNKDLERELRNAPMQTGAAQIMQRAQVDLDSFGAPIILQAHDQFILEVPAAELPFWVDTTRRVMEYPLDRGLLQGVVFPVDLFHGSNWGDQSPTNPRGLKAWTGEEFGAPSTAC